MAAQYTSKHGIVGRPQPELFMAFTDMRNFTRMVPQDQQVSLEADFDTLTATAQGMSFSAKIVERVPYTLIALEDNGAPFHFSAKFHFDDAGAGKTDFWVEVDAELNGILKMMLGSKIQDALDKMVDGMVQATAQV